MSAETAHHGKHAPKLVVGIGASAGGLDADSPGSRLEPQPSQLG